MSTKGQVCPRCSAFATVEPGGLRCSRCGHTPIFKRILPRDHWLSGHDWRNRERQAALDRTLVRGGRHEWILFDMLERLEGRARQALSGSTDATPPAAAGPEARDHRIQPPHPDMPRVFTPVASSHINASAEQPAATRRQSQLLQAPLVRSAES